MLDKRLVGSKINKLTIIDIFRTDKTFVKCICDCGKEKIIQLSCIKNGLTKSCGCIREEYRELMKKHHSKTYKRLYNIWSNIKQRCLNKNNRDYKKGYKNKGVYQDWVENFNNFYNWSINNGYKDNLTIDRIDGDKGYFPDNCRWVDMFVQASNKRLSKFNKTGYSGIDYRKEIGKYISRIAHQKKRYYLGCFDNLNDAVNARLKFIEEHNLKGISRC